MILISDSSFDPGERINTFGNGQKSAGAIASFIGQVRSENETVTTLHLQSYPGVTEKGIKQAKTSAMQKWALDDILIIHRIGTLNVGEPIVLVAVSAKHRRDAFEACDFLMDYLKTEAMFWKKQTGKNGCKWIEPRAQDYKDNERWS